jgi:hypothetical protein
MIPKMRYERVLSLDDIGNYVSHGIEIALQNFAASLYGDLAVPLVC